jgi:hypothetical protein
MFDYGEGHYLEEPPDEERRVFASTRVEPGSDWPSFTGRVAVARAGGSGALPDASL